MRRAKIIATLGPATAAPGVLAGLLRAGVDVARLNLSHGDHAEHARVIARTRRAAEALGRPIAILADLQGSKARIGRLHGGRPVPLRRGEIVTLTPRDVPGRPGLIPTTFRRLGRDVRRGDPILLDDGRIELSVVRVRGQDVVCRVITGGLLLENKGMNLPGTDLSGSVLTAKDRADLAFALRHGVDYLALSFVRSAEDMARVRRLLRRQGRDVPLIAKLEVRRAVERLQEILRAADGVMVARGDLGVEVPLERVPVLQKWILQEANRTGVIAITATQMLESMIERPRPTRAEASDVANAIFDGTDAVMLSAETASGRHPLKAVAVMDRIIREAERSGLYMKAAGEAQEGEDREVHAVAHAAVDAARQWVARAIVVYTQTGMTARLLSKLKPPCPIVAITPSEPIRRRMALYRGVLPLALRFARSTDRMLRDGERAILAAGLIGKGARVVVVSGTSPRAGATNLMKLHRLGERL
ncbi:MAG: pyruvate kinase [Acidobacteria bacterium 13_1_40CM_2_68_10]|nr:MAG: pyruvate kinase [Acidobacteria bacterium 13_1_40CM_2_68_10]